MSALLTFAGYPFCCIYEFTCDFNIGIDLRYSVDQFRFWHNPVVMKLCVITLFAAGSVQQRPCIQYIGCASFFAANGDFGFSIQERTDDLNIRIDLSDFFDEIF